MDVTKVELTIKGDLERLALKPSDFLVLTVEETITTEVSGDILDALSSRMGHNREKIIIVSGGARLSAIKKHDDENERLIETILIEDDGDSLSPFHCGFIIDGCDTLRPQKNKRVRVSDPFEVGIQVGETIVGFRGRNGVYIAIQSGLISYSFPSTVS